MSIRLVSMVGCTVLLFSFLLPRYERTREGSQSTVGKIITRTQKVTPHTTIRRQKHTLFFSLRGSGMEKI